MAFSHHHAWTQLTGLHDHVFLFVSLFSQSLLLLVHINPKLIQKVQLTKAPESLEQLYDELWEKLDLEGEFCLQYEDLDFGHTVCNLIDIAELPVERAVLHILWSNDESPSTTLSHTPSCASSISFLDTGSMSSPVSSYSLFSVIWAYWQSVSQWPKLFPIQTFSYDVALKLHKGNEIYVTTGTGLHVTSDMKMEILDKLAQEIFAMKAYPDKY